MILFLVDSQFSMGQHIAVVLNLNTKKETIIKINDSFYYGLKNSTISYNGKLEKVAPTSLIIDGKSIEVNDFTWINNKPYNEHTKAKSVANWTLFTGIGAIALGSYQYAVANDKISAYAIGGAGIIAALTGTIIYISHKKPLFNFREKHLLEIRPQIETTK